jgi:rfaE bifunctional protein kinase chain/domain
MGAVPRFSDYRDRVAGTRVLVVGDVMLDRYWFGEVSRISPEAPVPVVRFQRTEEVPGGAANVARNATALGARVTLLSVTGADEAGTALEALLEQENVRTSFHRDPALSTTVKLRVVARQQQMLRIDFETAPEAEVLAALLDTYSAKLAATGLVVLSDYGKGGLAHIERMIALARAAGKPVLVDPKGDEYDRYAGATLLTPNRAELREVVGRWRSEADLEERAQRLRRRLGVNALLLTRSEEGMTLFTDDGAWSVPAQAREVFDVSGAGDTVIAVMAAMMAAGLDLRDAVKVANRAGGIVVGKLGTATVSYDELFSGETE